MEAIRPDPVYPQVVKILHISANGHDAFSDKIGRHIKLFLAAAGDVDKSPLPRKPRDRRESKATAAACYQRQLCLAILASLASLRCGY